MTPARGAIRLTRSAMFSLTAVSLAVAAHAAGGERVSLPVAVLCVPAVMLVVNLLAARRRGAVSLMLGLGVTQVVLHAALMAAIMSDGCRMAGRHLSSTHAVTGYGAASVTTCDPGMAGHQASDMFSMSPRMFAAHAVAVLLLALLLARGEAMVWALTGNLSHRLALPRVVTPPPAMRPLPVLVREALLPLADVPRRGVRRRGPPARSLVS
ncbi:hypothetical protein GCM10022223_08070 [Kineosporia mesophila]|uniref:Integral membrane protein n=1 Tax=Kineosporia mesophila TaxID=566012 RepID=A0ABP6Z1N7_9ACTN|nr:hypothetical protein [Kineosporia mesophila]MCD5351185.1 hypothetical protein [Kineosporia mesophila]